MMGSQEPQKQMFSYQIDLDRRVRTEHPLRRIRETIDFGFVRAETGSDFALAEADALKLLDSFHALSATEEVYVVVEKVYAKDIGTYPSKTAEYCEKALRDPSNDAEKCRLYLDWGSALEKQRETNTSNNSINTRGQIAQLYLRVWGIISSNNVPETLQALPAVGIYRCTPESDPTCQAMERQHDNEMKVRETVWIQNELFLCRSTVVGRIALLYRNSPDALSEFELMASHDLQNRASVNDLLRRVRSLTAGN